MKANSPAERLYNGIIKENPTFVLMLGMCPTLATTTSAINGLGMGLTTMVILAMSNMMISLLRKVIPDGVRMPAYIVIVASFVTIVQFLLQGFIPTLYSALGIYIPLIVVNCIILGRAEAYASKNGVISSLFDGIGMGLGFTIGLTCIGIVRELLGSGKIFGFQLFDGGATIFILAPGAFFVLAMLVAVQNKVKAGKPEKASTGTGCGEAACAGCTNMICGSRMVSGNEEGGKNA
ncbi:electron transport complex subunit E [bacterium]|nr:electron transport complex subunit E [bacterium]MDY3023509.1 electron transport complex subunit E [Oliverpabstia sp.]